MLGRIAPYVAGAAVVVAILAAVWTRGERAGSARVEAEIAKRTAEIDAKLDAADLRIAQRDARIARLMTSLAEQRHDTDRVAAADPIIRDDDVTGAVPADHCPVDGERHDGLAMQ